MIKKYPEYILGGLGLCLLAVAAIFFFNKKEVNTVKQFPTKIHGGPCPGETQKMVQNDVYMRGVMEKGDPFKVITNYYDCNPIEKGDYVLYSLSPQLPPFVKIARAVEGDHFKLARDKKHKAWNLIVNGDVVTTETDHTALFFGDENPPTLSLYEKSHKGVVKNGEVILLSSWSYDNDSSIYGISRLVDVLGKVEPIVKGEEKKSVKVSEATR